YSPSPCTLILFFFYSYPHPRHLHSFPTRRSSDLQGPRPPQVARGRIHPRRFPWGEPCPRARSPLDRADGKAREKMERTVSVELADRKSTRLNSSHVEISYAVFCLKKKKN